MNRIIIDLEFTGLDNSYIKDNEVVQLKMLNITTGATLCNTYRTKKESGAGAYLCHKIKKIDQGYIDFSKSEFDEALKVVDADISRDQFYGFSISNDIKMLLKYDIHIPKYIDIQEQFRLTEYEQRIATEGSSLETLVFMVLGREAEINHGDESELLEMESLIEKLDELPKNEFLSLVPFGHCAGMPLIQYIIEYRRAADGYRFNNDNLYASSLDNKIDNLYDEDVINEDLLF